MPTTVEELFEKNSKKILGQAKWGDRVNCDAPGVYVVAMTPIANKMLCFNDAPISKVTVQEWINRVPQMTLANTIPTADMITQRIKSFWMPDETILYIGKAGTSLQTRIKQYYQTALGDPRPHRGGHWIKTLDNLSQLNIYWTTSEGSTAHDLETKFLNVFIQNVSQDSMRALFDPRHPFPFANLEFPKGVRKSHGLKNQANR